MIKAKDYKLLPNEPGCYLFKNKNEVVLYIGKAKNLKKRVNSYFTKKDHDPKTKILVSQIKLIDFFVTENEIEALILENNLIKKFTPKYNIELKDSRRYAYLYLNEEEYPFITVARTREKPGKYFGPFVSGRFRKEIQKVLSRQFKILSSKPSNLKKKSIDKKEYKERLSQVVKLLKGNVDGLIKSLEKEMKASSSKTHFEHALALKNQIEALSYLKEKQNMELKRNYDADVINFVHFEDKIYLLLFNIYKGVLENKQEFELENSETFFEEFLLKYYSTNEVPKELIVPKKIDDYLIQYLSKLRKKSFEVIFPQKGSKKALLNLALKNVQISLEGENSRVYELQKVLKLKKLPEIIECFDISHLRGKFTVASMVTFKKGKPMKSNYRKFKIRENTNGDDFLAMREVIYRRYAKSLKDTLAFPDLIVIDGGAGQLSSALNILNKLNLNIPVISLAKKLEEIYSPEFKGPLKLDGKNLGLLLLRAIRDEAHRFAINYNRSLRSKSIKKN